MRAYPFLALGSLCLAMACGGEVQQSSSHPNAGSAGSAGAGPVGGSGGAAGTSGKAGSGGTGGSSAFTACGQPGTCQLAPRSGCCGSCTPTIDDLVAVQYQHVEQYRKSICSDWPVMCEPCMEPPPQNFAAFCQAGACVVVDITQNDVSACSGSDQCVLQVAGCCPTCTPSEYQVVALNQDQTGTYQAQMCNPDMDYGCPGCIPAFPKNLAAVCISGHCAVVSTPGL